MKLIARAVGIVFGVALAVAAFGSGVASADRFAGKTYAEAAAKIAEWKGTAVIATVSGSQLDTDDCIVTSSSKSSFRGPSGESRKGEWLLNLDCNRPLASPGHPGNSLMTPEGRQEREDEASASRIAKDPTWCEKSDKNGAYCERLCKKTGLCDFEL